MDLRSNPTLTEKLTHSLPHCHPNVSPQQTSPHPTVTDCLSKFCPLGISFSGESNESLG
jgi:hypothetical protein